MRLYQLKGGCLCQHKSFKGGTLLLSEGLGAGLLYPKEDIVDVVKAKNAPIKNTEELQKKLASLNTKRIRERSVQQGQGVSIVQPSKAKNRYIFI